MLHPSPLFGTASVPPLFPDPNPLALLEAPAAAVRTADLGGLQAPDPIIISEGKADWNLTKDIFFVELLANECRALHKPIGGLTKAAWRTIVRDFTAKYGPFYQRDKLINRKRTLIEHYKMLKHLLESNSGFEWVGDKLKASESAWEEMIVKTPGVRSYRDKSFPPYESLRTIFEEGVVDESLAITGMDTAEANGSSSSDQVPASTPSRGKSRQNSTTPTSIATPRASSKPRRSKLQCRPKVSEEPKPDWNLTKDLLYVDLLANECRILRKPVGGLTKDAWQTIVREFTAKYGPFYQKDKLINRKRTLLDHYKMLKYLIETSSEFKWDGNKLTASESAWEEMIARTPGVRSYRDKSFPPYDSLCTIFEGEVADGREVVEAVGSSGEGPRELQQERAESSGSSQERVPLLPAPKRARSNDSGDSSRERKRRQREADRDAIARIAAAVEKFTETYAEASRHTPFRDVLIAMDETPELTEADYSRAVTVLASDPKLGDAFVLLPARRRVNWLRSIFC